MSDQTPPIEYALANANAVIISPRFATRQEAQEAMPEFEDATQIIELRGPERVQP